LAFEADKYRRPVAGQAEPQNTRPIETRRVLGGGPVSFCPIGPEHIHCVCGEKRRFFFNRDGLRIWRCGTCELEDIQTYLRCDYGPGSSVQFLLNTEKKRRSDALMFTEADNDFLRAMHITPLVVRRVTVLIHSDIRIVRKSCSSQEEAIEWLRQTFREGDKVVCIENEMRWSLLVFSVSLQATSVVALIDRANNRLVIAADCRIDRDLG
jgi:hypothetical protein